MVRDLVSFVKERELDIEADKTVVKQFLKSFNKNYQRIDNQSLAEERRKASLILENPSWEASINAAEQHPYLWGQIRCLLNWSDSDLASFDDYRNRLLQLLDCINENGLNYYAAVLSLVPDCWTDGNRLFQYNKDRDNSFKRYLREHTKEGQAYGANIKTMIDLWKVKYAAMSIEDFLSALISDQKDGCATWIQCIIKCPTILEEAWNKRVYSQNGHVIIAQRKTRDSHCFDPVLVYLRNICRNQKLEEKLYKLYDSKGEYEHAFKLEKGGHSYFIEWYGTDGNYSYSVDGNEGEITTASEVVSRMETIIQAN